MDSSRKIVSLFFSSLVIFFNATYYSVSHFRLEWKTLEKSEVNYFVSANPANLFIMQQKSSPTEFQGWKTEVHIPGFFALYKCISEPPLLKMIRKIFVVDSCSYTPCKSLILYPFHEFS